MIFALGLFCFFANFKTTLANKLIYNNSMNMVKPIWVYASCIPICQFVLSNNAYNPHAIGMIKMNMIKCMRARLFFIGTSISEYPIFNNIIHEMRRKGTPNMGRKLAIISISSLPVFIEESKTRINICPHIA